VWVLHHQKVVFFLDHQVNPIFLFFILLINIILGTGKTLLARAVASQLDCNFLKVVSSAIVDKYIGESARMIREMFAYAKDHQPCIIFMDEIDAIGKK
jgi:ATP-dependent 26S proteasome regulatory subunit